MDKLVFCYKSHIMTVAAVTCYLTRSKLNWVVAKMWTLLGLKLNPSLLISFNIFIALKNTVPMWTLDLQRECQVFFQPARWRKTPPADGSSSSCVGHSWWSKWSKRKINGDTFFFFFEVSRINSSNKDVQIKGLVHQPVIANESKAWKELRPR